jgi:putative Ca2+/H+ antiporter (TMEM165/GDT1 family)
VSYYLLLSYWTVLTAELVGDRSLGAVASLVLRFRPAIISCGLAAAFAAKMLVAVWLGSFLGLLPPGWISALSAATLFAAACATWWRTPPADHDGERLPPSWGGAALASFSVIFFSEWADFGQLAAATLTAKTHAPVAVWLGGSLALCTKGAVALALGVSLRRRISGRLARVVCSASCAILGLASLSGLLGR